MNLVIEQFYEAFQQLDAEKMVTCYHDDIRFSDPSFGILRADEACNMWRMLCRSQKNKNFDLSYSNIVVDGIRGSADWEAIYTFSKTDRTIHNNIHAEFTFRDGKIYTHADQFNLYIWARQALGPTGWLIGWTPFFRSSLKKQTRQMLNKFSNNPYE